VSGEPFPKASQLARGERRYRRKVAAPKQWQTIIAAKGSTCRLANSACEGGIEYHHLVRRGAPYFGDDLADNIVPLCELHHRNVTQGRPRSNRERLAASLSDAEYAYVIGKLGEGGMERLFGVAR